MSAPPTHRADARAGRAPGARAALRRGGAVPARGEGRAARELTDDDVARIKSEAMAAELARRAARARARRAGLVEARVGAGRGAVRALDQRALVAHPDRLQRARARARRSRSTAGCGRRCAASCHDAYAVTEEHAGSDPSGIATTARRRDGGWVIDGEKWFVTYGDVAAVYIVVANAEGEGPTLFLVDATLPGISIVDDPPFTHTYPHGHPTIRFTGVEVARRGRHRRRRRRRRAAARVVHRGADRDRGARGGGDVAAARRGDRVGAARASRAGARIMDHQGVSFPLADSRRRRRRRAAR